MITRSSTHRIALTLLLAASMQANAAVTDLASAPLITDPTAAVLPNVFLVLDDSLTMEQDFMPSEASNFDAGRYGIASNQCNGVYYDPTYRYVPPVDASAVSYPNSNFNAAWIDGFNTGLGTVNLSTSFVDGNSYYRSVDAAQPAFYYVYSGFQTNDAQKNYYDTAGIFYRECRSVVGSTTAVDGTHPVNTLFTKVSIVAATTSYTKALGRTDCAGASCTFAEESQNFANWYSFYRNRMLTMKTATGLAFRGIGSNFRLGFASINNNTGADYLGLSQFNNAQKSSWYNKLYSAVPGQSSPLRIALANVGKMYANSLATFNGVAVVDPVEYSCQQNFTILTSDGSWNGLPGTKLDGLAVGNQDGNVARPQYDGTYQLRSTSQTTQTDTQQTENTTRVEKWTEQNQTQTSELQRRTGPLQWRTNQKRTDNTLQWKTKVQKTDATLQWQTDLQKTDATLQWKTNLQHVDAPLQWKTDLQLSTQNQLWSIDQQRTTAPLQWQTKQQITTAPLRWATNLQQTTAALQWRTNLQATSGTLQARTSTLQKQVTQKQTRTSTLQVQTSQLQSRTSTLQGSTMYLQTRTSFNSGGLWGSWGDVGSCTWAQQVDGFYRECRYVTASSGSTVWTAAAGTWTNPASCTQSYGTSSTPGTTWNNGTSCRYTAWTAFADATSCVAATQASGAATARECQTVVKTAYATATGTCTATTVPNASGVTTQCRYNSTNGVGTFSNWAGASTCTAAPMTGSSPFTQLTARECQDVVTSAWSNAAATCTTTTVPDGSGNTTQCRYNSTNGVGTFSNWANVGASSSCATAAMTAVSPFTQLVAKECQLTGSATAYVSNPPTCSVTYNNPGTSTSDASGKSISACANTGATYSSWANVGGSASCATGAAGGSGGGLVECQMAAATPAYLAYGATCTSTYNAGGTSTASGGNVTTCSTAGSFNPTPTTLTGSQSCTTGANVQCSTGAATTTYTTYAAPTCSVTYNNPGTSTASSGSVVTACPVSGTWSSVTVLTNGQSCTGNGTTVQCPTGTANTAYVSYAEALAGSCAVNYGGLSGSSTAGTGGLVTTACPTAAWTTPVLGACTDALHTNCTLSTAVTNYVTTYPPTCTAGTTAGVVTTCSLNASLNPVATNIGANGTCAGGVLGTAGIGNTWGRTVQCLTGTPLAAAYVNTYAPTCATNFNGASGSSTANASGNVITSCPVNGVYGPATSTGAGNICNGALANVQCIATAGAATARIATYPPTCATTFNAAGSSTANASGKVITACPLTTFGGAQNTGAGNTCDGTLANVQCIATASPATNYVTSYPPTCATTFAAAATSTADGSGKVITACPVNVAYGAANNTGNSLPCNGALANVQCIATAGASTNYITTYPPTCTTTFNAAGISTSDASGKVLTACPTATPAGTFDVWRNTTVGNVSCTAGATVQCRYNWGAWANIGTCTDNYSTGAGAWSILSGTSCQYTGFHNAANVANAWSNYASATCTPVAQPASASGSSTAVARNCRVNTAGNTPESNNQVWVPSATCTANAPAFNGSGQRINCQTLTTGPTLVPTCTPGTSGVSPYKTTTCPPATVIAPAHGVASCTAGTLGVSPFTTTTCNTTSTVGVPFTPCIAEAASASNGYTATVCSVPTGGTFDTLADVAQYYYMTDLRTTTLGNQASDAPGLVNGSDVSTNNVPQSSNDTAQYQHMTTFTVGLGARGRMAYDSLYQSTASGDYHSVAQGAAVTALSSAAGVCSWQSPTSTCNWPIPAYDSPEDIDDLWHAAVDGRGTYFSAKNPSDLGIGLIGALADIQSRLGSAAAATTSTAFVTQGDNFLFRSSYVSLNWTGELTRQQLDPNTGAVLTTIDWSAQSKLDSNASRTIYTFDPTNTYSGNTSKLKLFTYAKLTATQQGYFDLTTLPELAQFAAVCPTDLVCLTATDEANASGSNLVNYIAGSRTNEGGKGDNTKYFRQRLHLLGDIVDSESFYIKVPAATFSDPGYVEFKASKANRLAMVYVGSNDGMLHAFRAADDTATTPADEGGQEDWAYIPSLVMPDLYKLADKNYGQSHRYYVDGSPVGADICISNCNDAGTTSPYVASTAVWKTILVGGLNLGGRGFYALDVTDPANPKALWEFTNANMGFSYGNPKVVKLANGTWVVMVTSGYNNVPPYAPSGDGHGHLYVLNAYTGALIRDIDTGVGDTTTPSGLSRIDAPVTTPGIDATAIAVYGGDLLGNLWRFDVNDNLGDPSSGYDAQLLATLKDSSGVAQPITSKPLISVLSGYIVVNIGTGRYLGATDQNSATHDSFYAIKDTYPVSSTPAVAIYGDPRTYTDPSTLGTFVEQTQTAITCPVGTPASVCSTGEVVYQSSNLPVSFETDPGWYTDFSQTGERDNTDPAILKGTLVIATNLPSASSCSIGGDSFLYQLDFRTGGAVSTAPNGIIGTLLGHELTSRPVVVMLQDGTSITYTQGSGGGTPKASNVWENASADGVARRISWRELIVK